MARRNFKKSNYGRKISKRKSANKRGNSNDLVSFARKMGMVKRGLENPDSRISEAYERGVIVPEKRKKKPLF